MTFRDRFNLRKATAVSISRPIDNTSSLINRRKSSSGSKADKFRTQRRKSSIARAHADMMYRNLYPRFDLAVNINDSYRKETSHFQPTMAMTQQIPCNKQTRPSIITTSCISSSQQPTPKINALDNQQNSFQKYIIRAQGEENCLHNSLHTDTDESHSPTSPVPPAKVFPDLRSLAKDLPDLPKPCHGELHEYTAQQHELVKFIEAKLGIRRSHYDGSESELMFPGKEDQIPDDSIFANFFTYARSITRQDSGVSISNSSNSESGYHSQSPTPSVTSHEDQLFPSSHPQPRLTTFDDLIRWGSMDTSKDSFDAISNIASPLKAKNCRTSSRSNSVTPLPNPIHLSNGTANLHHGPWPIRQSSKQAARMIEKGPFHDIRRTDNNRDLHSMFSYKHTAFY